MPTSRGRSSESRSRPPRTKPGKPVLAGGAVVTREHPTRGTEVAIVHRKRYDDWSLPKGKVDAGESLPACAVREVHEETGLTIKLGVPLDMVRYEVGKTHDNKGAVKQVQWWGGSVLSAERRAPDDEVDVVSWLPVRPALSRLSYEQDRFLVRQLLDQPATTPLLIVRHGKAMDRKDWSKKDTARPLNARGRRQATLLVPMLAAYGVARVVSSTSTRCVSTVQPYARSVGLRVESYDRLTEEEGAHDPRGVAKVVHKIRSGVLQERQSTALCFHRPVLPHILDALGLPPVQLTTGEFLVAHLTADGEVHAWERHRPQA